MLDFRLLSEEVLSIEGWQLILPLFIINVLLRRSKVLYLLDLLWRIGFDSGPEFPLRFFGSGDRLFANGPGQLIFLEKAIY